MKPTATGTKNTPKPAYGALLEAVREGAAQRVRPIMMTVCAIIAGLLPILWSHGAGTLKKAVEKWGDLGKLTLPDVLHLPRGAVVVIMAVLLTAALATLKRIFPR